MLTIESELRSLRDELEKRNRGHKDAIKFSEPTESFFMLPNLLFVEMTLTCASHHVSRLQNLVLFAVKKHRIPSDLKAPHATDKLPVVLDRLLAFVVVKAADPQDARNIQGS